MDYDGNGRLDLIAGSDDCCNHDREFFLWRRGTDGRFRDREAIPTRDTGDTIWFMVRTKAYVADWDGDGQPDLFVTGPSGVYLALGPLADRAEVELSHRIEGSEALRRIQTKPNVADWDGDGRPDLLVGAWEGPEGTGVYLLRGLDGAEGSRLAAPELLIAAPVGASVNGLDVADWDGDGIRDLIVGLTWWARVEDGPRKSRSQVWVYRRVPPD